MPRPGSQFMYYSGAHVRGTATEEMEVSRLIL